MIKALLFDLDGTLIDTNELILKSFKYALNEKLNAEVSDEVIKTFFGEPLTKTLCRYSENVEEVVSIYREYNKLHHDKLCKEFSGVKEALKLFKEKGLAVAVVTSKVKPMALRGLDLTGLGDYIDVIITPEDTENHKPKGEPAEKACELLGIATKEAIMIGDSFYDILCGKDAGCYTAAVSYTSLPLDMLKKHDPDYVIDNILELLEIVENINKESA